MYVKHTNTKLFEVLLTNKEFEYLSGKINPEFLTQEYVAELLANGLMQQIVHLLQVPFKNKD